MKKLIRFGWIIFKYSMKFQFPIFQLILTNFGKNNIKFGCIFYMLENDIKKLEKLFVLFVVKYFAKV